MGRKSDIFVNYEGPRLNKDQKLVVRSRAMVSARARMKDAANQKKVLQLAELGPNAGNAEATAPHTTDAEDTPETSLSRRAPSRPARSLVPILPRPRDMGPTGFHPTGIHARVFQDYLSRCSAYSSYLDEAFILVGFQRPNFFRPDMSKPACVYIGWLITTGILDAFRGTCDISYPFYEWNAVRELQGFLDTATNAELYQVVYPVAILGMFEMVRFSPYTITHLAAVERFIKTRGGLQKMPPPMQAIVIMADLLQCICLDTKLAFSTVGRPVFHVQTTERLGDHMLSSPLLRCDQEDFSLVARFIGPGISTRLAQVLTRTYLDIQGFCDQVDRNEASTIDRPMNLDDVADGVIPAHDASGLVVQTCAVASRVVRRTLEKRAGYHHSSNWADMRLLYDNLRFINLKSWAGLPYLHLWVNLVGLASSTKLERSYFVAQLMRATFSYGCYQMDVFITFLKNFVYLRRAVSAAEDAARVGQNEEV